MLQERLPGLHSVERVFRQDEGAGRRRGPGVDQGNLKDVELFLLPRNETARLVVHKRHVGIAVQVPGEIAEAPVDSVNHVVVDLDGQD